MKLSPRQLEAARLVAAGRFYPCLVREEDGWYARWRAIGVENAWVDEYVRAANVTPLTEDAEDQKHETLHDAWLMALTSRTGLVRWDEAACATFAAELTAWAGAAEEDIAARRSIVFELTSTPAGFTLSCEVPKGRRALASLGQATYVWSALSGLRRSSTDPRRLTMALRVSEAEAFLQQGAAALSAAGYSISGAVEKAAIVAKAEQVETKANAPTPTGPVRLVVKVNGEPVTAEEIRFLLEQGSSLVFFREHWIEVDRNILREALRALEKNEPVQANLISFALGIGHIGNLEVEELKAHGWLRGLLHELQSRTDGRPLVSAATPADFVGTLRDYQAEGVQWLKFLTDHGFGALLADEMGLGKTIQTIAWILSTPRAAPVLIVAPLTLLANWRHELATFAPSLTVYLHQGESRHFVGGFRRTAEAAQVVLTSYNLLVKDYTLFSGVIWEAIVLDEAQIAKNPRTQIARAIRALSPARRLALTGTPIENSPLDVWSLEDFLNPGFLGDERSFRERFLRPLSNDPHAAAGARLRHALEPFVLRRTKSDPRIVAELGEKREVREYCALDVHARRAYEAELSDFRALPHTSGDALALLTRLKLICDGEAKIHRLFDLLEQIFAADESALVFTQYAKVGHQLQTRLAERFGKCFPFLRGDLSASARENEIRKFNLPGARAFLLSLRAGGFGLNLTKATHVIHFDRWWNPAVENQATDRAHRLGQTQNVLVHLLVTSGTIEERVDEILRQKGTLKELLSDGAAFWKAVQLA